MDAKFPSYWHHERWIYFEITLWVWTAESRGDDIDPRWLCWNLYEQIQKFKSRREVGTIPGTEVVASTLLLHTSPSLGLVSPHKMGQGAIGHRGDLMEVVFPQRHVAFVPSPIFLHKHSFLAINFLGIIVMHVLFFFNLVLSYSMHKYPIPYQIFQYHYMQCPSKSLKEGPNKEVWCFFEGISIFRVH